MATTPEVKVGKVTWCNPLSGAFIEDLDTGNGNLSLEKSTLPTTQVYVPRRLLQNVSLIEGQLVRYSEENAIATSIEPLAPASAYKRSQ